MHELESVVVLGYVGEGVVKVRILSAFSVVGNYDFVFLF
jgi:hypothetical protein